MDYRLPEEEKVRQVLRELRKRDRSEEVENDIRTLERVLEDPLFRKQLSSRNSREVSPRHTSRGTSKLSTTAPPQNIECLKRELEQHIHSQLKENQKLIFVDVSPSDTQPVVLETRETRPRLLVVGPKDIKSRTSGRIRIGDRIVAVSGRNEDLRQRRESPSSPRRSPLSESSHSCRLLEDLKVEFESICERAFSNNQHLAFALIREHTQMVLSGDWTQVEVIHLPTGGGGLGFGIVGGTSTGVVVKTILPGSPADKDKRLRPGDHILQIGNVNTHGMTSQQVATILRQQDPAVEMIVGRPIVYTERPPDTADCWTMATRAALNPSQLEEHVKERRDQTEKESEETQRNQEEEQAEEPSPLGPVTSNGHVLTGPTSPIEKNTETVETTDNQMSRRESKTSRKSSSHSKKSIIEEQSKSEKSPTSLPSSPCNVPSTSTSLSAQSHSISLKTLQEMALTVFLRENWESSGKYEMVDVVLHRDPALGLGITVAGYVHKKEEIGGVFVKSLVPKSAASHCGKIRVHDLILEVNGDSLEHLSHADSVRTLVKSGDTVRLRLVRFHTDSPQSLCLQMLQKQETETQVIDVQSSNPDLVSEWKRKLSGDVDIIQAVIRPDRKEAGDGGLGIALEGTVDVVDGTQLCPHHYIGSIRNGGPAAKTGLLQAGDELLQVNHFPLYGESHVTVRQALTRAVQADAPVTLIIARKAQHLNVFVPRSEKSLPLSYSLLAGGSEQIVKAKSDICLASPKENTSELLEEVSRRLRSRSLEPLTGMAIWNCVPLIVWLEKDTRGLGFSIVDYKDPLHSSESVIVVQSLVPGGVAQADGRIVPGDRLLFVNDHDLSNSSLERAVAVLKAAPMGAVRLGIAKPVPVDQCDNAGHSPIITRTERFLAKGSSPRGRRRYISSTHTSQETVWIGADQYRRLHPQGYFPSRSPSARSDRSSLNGSSLSMSSWSPCSTRSISPSASPLSLRGSWAYDVIYLPAHLERNVKILKGVHPLGIVVDTERDKCVNGCVVKSICGKKAVARDGRIQVGDFIVKINNESLRNVTSSQARAILKRTNLIGTQCNVTYITSSDAKLWKERFAKESEPHPPEISRLSPKIFPKFYKSPYLGGDARMRCESPPDTSHASLMESSLGSPPLGSPLIRESSPLPDTNLSNLIDGLIVDEFVYDILQSAIQDALLEVVVAHVTPDWRGREISRSTPPSASPPPIPRESPPRESIDREESVESRKQPETVAVKEKPVSPVSPVSPTRGILIRRDSEPAIAVKERFEPLSPILLRSVQQSAVEREERIDGEDIVNNNQAEEERVCERVEHREEESTSSVKSPETPEDIESRESTETEESQTIERRESVEIEENERERENEAEKEEETRLVESPTSNVVEEEKAESIEQKEEDVSKEPSQVDDNMKGDQQSRTSSAGSEVVTPQNKATTARSKFWGEARTVILVREPNKSFGISIVGGRVEVSQKGGLPGTGNTVSGIFIKSVLPNSPAGKSGQMSMGDRVISVNDIDLRDATHEQAVQAIKHADNPVRFVLQSLHSFSPQQQMISSASNSTVGSIRIETVRTEETQTVRPEKIVEPPREIAVITEKVVAEIEPVSEEPKTEEVSTTPPVPVVEPPPCQPSTSESIQREESVKKTERTRHKSGSVKSQPSIESKRKSSQKEECRRTSKDLPLVVSDVSSSETQDSPMQEEPPEGVEMGSAAGLMRDSDDKDEQSRYGYTQKKISTKYGSLPGEVLFFELKGIPEAGLGMSLAGNKDRDKLSVFVVATKVACPLPIRIGDELLEINGRLLTNMSHLAASSKIRECCETDYLEMLVLRRFHAQKDMAVNRQSSDEKEPVSATQSNASERNANEKVIEKKSMAPTTDDSPAMHAVEILDVRKKSFAAERLAGIETGKETLIEIDKDGKGLGLSIVGGSDTVLGTVVIHEVYPDGAAAIDGRLKPGDQVLEVNNISLRGVSHEKAISLLRRTPPKVRLLVYRDVNLQLSLLDPTQIYNIFEVELTKRPGRGLGLSIVGRKNEPGVYVSEVVRGGAAEADNRLMTGDQILSVNGADVANSMQEDVAAMLKACVGKVSLKVGRWKITETANRVHAAAEAAFGKEKSPVRSPPKSEEQVPSTSTEQEKVPPPPAPPVRPTITHTAPDGETVEGNHSGLSPVTEEPSSGTAEQRSLQADEDKVQHVQQQSRQPHHNVMAPRSQIELLKELNEEGSDTMLIELRKVPDQQLGMGIGKRTRGILVTSLQPGSSAAEKLKVGDRILAVNALPVTDQLSAVTFVKASGERLYLQIGRPRHHT